MKKTTLSFFAAIMLMIAGTFVQAQSFPENWKSFDLTKYGMKFSFMAPASAEFDYDGDMEELYINAPDDNFRMMISVWEDESPEGLIEEAKEEVEEGGDVEFVGYVHESKNGFLAEESIEGETDFEVYFAFAIGGKTFYFQTNPLPDALYSAEAGENMYNTCKKAAGM